MEKNSKIYVAGSSGLLGSAIVRRLNVEGYNNLLTPTHKELDLTFQKSVDEFFFLERPEYVFLAAAKVGGILANSTYKGEFIYDNLMIATNVIHHSQKYGVKKLLNLGSNCIYPKLAPNPIREESLLTGELEPTNEPYAIAKIAAIKMCEAYRSQYGCNFISALPCNLYGEGDHYDLERCHVMPALIRKFHEAKVNNIDAVIWGDGLARREFLYVDDCSNACVFLMNNYNESTPINIGSGTDISIKELAEIIAKVVEFKGQIIYDTSKPTGTLQKRLDVSKINSMAWVDKISLTAGIRHTYEYIIENKINEQWT